MSESECEEWQSMIYVLAVDVNQAAVLLQQNEDHAYILPSFQTEGGLWETRAAQMQNQIRLNLGLNGRVLYRAGYQEDTANCRGEGLHVLETLEPETLPGHWHTRQTLEGIPLVNSQHRSLIENTLLELETGRFPEQRPPWTRPGWQAEAERWMTAELAQAGWMHVGPAEPIKSWCLSYVMRIPAAKTETAENQWFYFKTSLDLPLFVNEAVVTEGLAALFPNHVPAPLAIEAQKNWLLLSDFGPLIGRGAALEDRLRILHHHAVLQIQSAGQIEQLLALGCCDRRLDWLAGHIEPLFNHPETAQVLTGEEVARLQKLAGPLRQMCRKLDAFAIPPALIHGDLHGSNVAGQKGEGQAERLLFFDWTDSAISHPFFDMLLIFFEKDITIREKMRDTYLEDWLIYEPLEQLLDAWSLAETLAALYHALSYFYILINIEDWGRNELDWELPIWLRKIIELGELTCERQ
jgi:hypothetical protein